MNKSRSPFDRLKASGQRFDSVAVRPFTHDRSQVSAARSVGSMGNLAIQIESRETNHPKQR